MWVVGSTFHTASAAKPKHIIGRHAAKVVKHLRGDDREHFAEWLLDRQEQLFVDLADMMDELPRDREIARWPAEPLIGEVRSVKQVRCAFEEVPIVWQLDALLALEDALDA